MTDAFKKFLEVSELYMKDGRTSASNATLDNRQRTLTSYIRCLDESGEDPGVLGVLKWKQSMQDRGLKKSTIRQYLVELHAFYNWAIDHRFYTENPVKKSDYPRAVKNPYQLMSEEQMLRLLERKPPQKYRSHQFYWFRNRAIVVTLITTSIRNHELMNLTMSDLDWENSEILIRSGKGDKDRFVNFPEIAQAAIREYMSFPQIPADPPPDFPVFVSIDRKTGTPQPIQDRKTLSVFVQRYVRHMLPEYNADVRSHALRHVGASLLLTNGDSMEQIQHLLGHAELSTTKIYAARLRPDKTHVQNANRIWDEIAYQTGRSKKSSEESMRKRLELEPPPAAEEPRQPPEPQPRRSASQYDGSKNIFGESII